LIDAIQREFPFSQQTRQGLESLQQSLGLRDEDIARVEQPLIQQAEIRCQENLRQAAEQQRQDQEKAEYENKLRQYEQEFTKATQKDYPLNQVVLDRLKTFQQQLELTDEDVARVEQPISEPVQAKYQEELRQQEQAKQQQIKEAQERRKAEEQEKQRLAQEKAEQQAERERQQQAQAQKQAEAQRKQQEQAGAERKRRQAEAQRKREEAERQKQAAAIDQDDLSSERWGANYYAKLRDLLAAKDWKAADQETAQRMCDVMARQKESWLRVEDIENFPCQDLRNIDRLWVKYSNGKFGFSVQREIWQSCGSPTDYNKNWEKFGVVVGWRNTGVFGMGADWLPYSLFTFDLIAPKGHLPAMRWRGVWNEGVAVMLRGWGVGMAARGIDVCGGVFGWRRLLSRQDL